VPGYNLRSRGTEVSWQLQNDGKKGIRQCKYHSMCDAVAVIRCQDTNSED
jgi:hypothetical protein